MALPSFSLEVEPLELGLALEHAEIYANRLARQIDWAGNLTRLTATPILIPEARQAITHYRILLRQLERGPGRDRSHLIHKRKPLWPETDSEEELVGGPSHQLPAAMQPPQEEE